MRVVVSHVQVLDVAVGSVADVDHVAWQQMFEALGTVAGIHDRLEIGGAQLQAREHVCQAVAVSTSIRALCTAGTAGAVLTTAGAGRAQWRSRRLWSVPIVRGGSSQGFALEFEDAGTAGGEQQQQPVTAPRPQAGRRSWLIIRLLFQMLVSHGPRPTSKTA